MCTDLLICNALIGHKTVGEDGHNGRAVVARVGGDHDYQRGADEERLHNSALNQQLSSQQDYSRGRRRINMEIAAIFVLA